MKTILIALGLTQIIIGSVNGAESTKWAQGPFWKAPQYLEFSRKMIIVDQELNSNCKDYTKFVTAYKKDIPTDSLARLIDQTRKEGLTVPMQTSFKGRFEVLDIPVNRIIENDFTAMTLESESEILPMYNQVQSSTGINLNNVSAFNVVASEDSLTAFSKKLGLEESMAVLSFSRLGKTYLEVNGSDLACDLLSKKVTLKAQLPSYVRITKEASLEIESFYNSKIAPQITEVLVRSESATIKAARLGFRLGKALEEKNDGKYNDQLVEAQIGNLIDRLFVPKTLIPSSLLIGDDNKKGIDFTSSINGSTAVLELRMQ